nr:lanosterol synthase [Quercus suber]
MHPIPPELWLLPDWMPIHPWRWWVQCRVVYLPTSYLYSKRFAMPLNPLLSAIREEIYVQSFSEIDFSCHKSTVAAADIKKPHSLFLKMLNILLGFWELIRPTWLLERAQRRVCELIKREDENTNYNDLAPVNKAFQMVSVFCADGVGSPRVKAHQQQLPTYLWLGDDGMTCSGTNGVQVWDTAFSIQAAVEAGFADDPEFQPSLIKALHFMDISQLESNLADPYRQQRKGGWPFSTKDNGYIVSDCAAEGLKAVMLLQRQRTTTVASQATRRSVAARC